MVLKEGTRIGQHEIMGAFQRLLPTPALVALVQAWPSRFYWRIYSPLVMLWGFTHQFLLADSSCDGVVGYLSSGELDAWEAAESQVWRGFAPPQPLSARMPHQNSSYCQARQRFPVEWLQECLAITARRLHQEARQHWSWQERTVLQLDGTTFLTQATAELIQHYGRHQNQNGEGHWPVLRSVACFDMHTGAAVALVEGTLHASEQALAIELFQTVGRPLLNPTEFGEQQGPEPDGILTKGAANGAAIYVGDRNFGVFSVAQAAVAAGQDFVLRLTDKRAKALVDRCLPELSFESLASGSDLPLDWRPSRHDQVVPTIAPEAQFPHPAPDHVPGRLLYWRLERPGFRPQDIYLFTNLQAQPQYSITDVVALYGSRWQVEQYFRELKDTLELGHLRSKSVAMVRKELCAGLLAYNLIRGVMLMAAIDSGCKPLDLSFIRSWRRIQIMAMALSPAQDTMAPELRLANLLRMVGGCQIYHRKKTRSEPRAVRGKPCPYPHIKGERKHSNLNTPQN